MVTFTEKEKNESWVEHAYRRGEDARYEGIPRESNPYHNPGILYYTWLRGWNETNEGLLDAAGEG